jgi:hypothetical protein
MREVSSVRGNIEDSTGIFHVLLLRNESHSVLNIGEVIDQLFFLNDLMSQKSVLANTPRIISEYYRFPDCLLLSLAFSFSRFWTLLSIQF